MKEKITGVCDGYPRLLTSLNLELNTQLKGIFALFEVENQVLI